MNSDKQAKTLPYLVFNLFRYFNVSREQETVDPSDSALDTADSDLVIGVIGESDSAAGRTMVDDLKTP